MITLATPNSGIGPYLSVYLYQLEAQLMLTNPRDAFTGQSRSPNIVPFRILGIVFSCAIVTLLLSGAVQSGTMTSY